MKKFKKSKAKAPATKVNKYYLFNQGKQYMLLVTSPIDVLPYRIKEIVDGNFVGKKEAVTFNPDVFCKLNPDITYTVTEV